jgi:hypothetical protein
MGSLGRQERWKYDLIGYHPSMNLSKTNHLPIEVLCHMAETIIIHSLVIQARAQAGSDILIKCT